MLNEKLLICNILQETTAEHIGDLFIGGQIISFSHPCQMKAPCLC